jgi:type III pantothenate kinase
MGVTLPLIAVDVGNARVKFGLLESLDFGDGFPEPSRTLHVPGRPLEVARVAAWLAETATGRAAWWIGSVNRPAATSLIDWLRAERPNDPITLLAVGDLPLVVAVERPERVGVDRLLDAVAANRLRRPGCPAIVVDVGTAITVDLVAADGAFQGGAILPGIAMSARAMHEFTDLLPLVEMSELGSPPPALGTSTVPAMKSGLFWGAVGSIRQLVERMAEGSPTEPEVFLTGGAGSAVAELLGRQAHYVPHLTLAGIALAAQTRIPGT